MQIIKEVLQEYKHKCKYCKSVYSYTAKDVDHTWYNHIICPVCKSIDETSIFDRKVKEK